MLKIYSLEKQVGCSNCTILVMSTDNKNECLDFIKTLPDKEKYIIREIEVK